MTFCSLEGLQVCQFNCARTKAFSLFNLVPIKYLDCKVSAYARRLRACALASAFKYPHRVGHTTETVKFSFHSGLRVFFLVCDLKTFCPLSENTTNGSDLPGVFVRRCMLYSMDVFTSPISCKNVFPVKNIDAKHALICPILSI